MVVQKQHEEPTTYCKPGPNPARPAAMSIELYQRLSQLSNQEFEALAEIGSPV
jgi:hypothetical protein